MQTNSGKLSCREKVGYGLGDIASSLFFQTFILFLVYFCTHVFGMSVAAQELVPWNQWRQVEET